MIQLLFDLQENLSIIPAVKRSEPVVWIEHLAIVDSLNDRAEIIREVSFRRGLNIIRTEQRLPSEKNSIGHDVGKTLLTRFIRYLLGEQFYGNRAVRNALYYSMKDAYVIGRIFVNGTSWIVARPIGQIDTQKHFAFQGDDWKEALTSQEHSKFSLYIDAIADAILSNIINVNHSRVNKKNQWLNILAWLTRDQKCALRSITDWRHPATESGTGQIQQKEANYLIRLVIDILDTEEQEAIFEHKKLLQKKRELVSKNDSLQRNLNALHVFLNGSHFEVNQDKQLVINKHKNDILKKIAGYKRLRQDYNRVPIPEEKQYTDKKSHVDRIDGQLTQLKNNLKYQQGLLDQRQAATDNQHYVTIKELCTHEDCPFKKNNVSAIDYEKEYKIKEYKEEIERIENDIAKLISQYDQEKRELADIKSLLLRKRKDIQKRINGINGAISRFSIQKKQIEQYEEYLDEQIELNNELKSNSQQIDESNNKQLRIREEYNERKRKYETYLEFVTQHLMNENDHSKITIDGNGLQVDVDKNRAGSGEASNSGMVLSFDWAACIAGIGGLGYHPRFLIHDSPREADREHEAYQQLFYFVRQLDSMFSENTQPFQYIITTTTQPPNLVLDAPYVRVTLHSRDINGLLLRRFF
ncbi:MAG: hypothetical protein LBG80_00010 [Bacteroidales bacterium]|jgi:uncharacterized protein YydD (DUF2326 family)|nr:hypothetical protein [Bacteroidales bacterium]